MAPVPTNHLFAQRLASKAISHVPDLQTWIIFVTAIAIVSIYRVVSRKCQQQNHVSLPPPLDIKLSPQPDLNPVVKYLPPPPGAAAAAAIMTHPYLPEDFYPILTSGHLAAKADRDHARDDISSDDVVPSSMTPCRRHSDSYTVAESIPSDCYYNTKSPTTTTTTTTTTNSTILDDYISFLNSPEHFPKTCHTCAYDATAVPSSALSNPIVSAWPAMAEDSIFDSLRADATMYFPDPDFRQMWRRQVLEFEG